MGCQCPRLYHVGGHIDQCQRSLLGGTQFGCGVTTLTMLHFRQHYNEWGKKRIFLSLAVIEANFATNSVETVCPDSFFSKFAVVLRLM